MSINIGKAQAEALSELGNFASEEKSNVPVKLTILQKVLAQYASEFQLEVEKNIKNRKVTASGRLRDNIEPEFDDDGFGFRIIMPDYFDYPNKGVKGVDFSNNAPNSPYKYRHYKMNAAGRASIKEYIEDANVKISSVRDDKALGIGLERKGVSLIDRKVNVLIYLIKRYGIKTTNYFDDAFEKVFKDFAVIAADVVGRDIVIKLQRLKPNK
jgi:hypothetical protein